jgi:hypothetical protein
LPSGKALGAVLLWCIKKKKSVSCGKFRMLSHYRGYFSSECAPADSENGRLRRVEDGDELGNVEHPQI